MTKLSVMAVCLLVACGKGDKSDGAKPGSAAGAGPAAGVKAEPPAKKGAKGSVTTSGAYAATWDWKDEFAMTCSWIPDLNMGRLSITMGDGADGAMALDGLFSKERTEVTVTSGKLKSPSPFKQAAGGVVITGTVNPETVTAQFDAVTTRGDETLNVKGTITARCN